MLGRVFFLVPMAMAVAEPTVCTSDPQGDDDAGSFLSLQHKLRSMQMNKLNMSTITGFSYSCDDGSSPDASGCCDGSCPSGCSSSSVSSNNGNTVCCCAGCPIDDGKYYYVCDDGSAPNSNGCCDNGGCPSSSTSSSISSTNGVTTCSCSVCGTVASTSSPTPTPSSSSSSSISGNGWEYYCDDGSNPDSGGCCDGSCPSGCSSSSVSSNNGEVTCCCAGCPKSTGYFYYTCDDGSSPDASGCCDGSCPSDATSASVSSTNGVTTCSCAVCGSARTVSASTTECDSSSCAIYSDPHVVGFDSFSGHEVPSHLALISIDHRASHTRPIDVNSYETGDFWLLRNDQVRVQGRFVQSKEFVPDRAAVGTVAVGGPFLDGKLLKVGADSIVTWDGHPLDSLADVTLTKGRVHISSHSGPVVDGKPSNLVHAKLPLGINITFFQYPKYMDTKITIPTNLMVDGECGNNNGVAEDDTEEAIQKRMGGLKVSSADLLF